MDNKKVEKLIETIKSDYDCNYFKLTLAPDFMEFATEKVVFNIEEKDDSDNRLYTA